MKKGGDSVILWMIPKNPINAWSFTGHMQSKEAIKNFIIGQEPIE